MKKVQNTFICLLAFISIYVSIYRNMHKLVKNITECDACASCSIDISHANTYSHSEVLRILSNYIVT